MTSLSTGLMPHCGGRGYPLIDNLKEKTVMRAEPDLGASNDRDNWEGLDRCRQQVRKSHRFDCLKHRLVHSHESPQATGCRGDTLAPNRHGIVFRPSAFPDAAFRFNDPAYGSFGCFLHYDPIGMVEADRTARL
jgi:hypothetical protein